MLERFLACGDLHYGFARLDCDQCGQDYLLAYSCKTRYFCPSCHQKRMLVWLRSVADQGVVLVPSHDDRLLSRYAAEGLLGNDFALPGDGR